MNIALAGQTYSHFVLLCCVFQHEVSEAIRGLLPSSPHLHTPVRPVSTSKGLNYLLDSWEIKTYQRHTSIWWLVHVWGAPPAVERLRRNVEQKNDYMVTNVRLYFEQAILEEKCSAHISTAHSCCFSEDFYCSFTVLDLC